MIVGSIPFTNETPPRVLLINSRKHPEEWLLPKGGWESDEVRTAGARRETWEEAGVLGELLQLQKKECAQEEEEEEEDRDHPLLVDFPVKGKNHNQLHTYYGLLISEMKEDWPEREERGRQLFSFAEAGEVLSAQERRRDRQVQCTVLEQLKRRLAE
jgi:diphosphoinositol-polyphosphate diphosphatase